MTKTEIAGIIQKLISEETGRSDDLLEHNTEFFNYGIDSLKAVFLLEKLERQFSIQLDPIIFWDYPTIESLAEYIENKLG